nr:10676_t:CDS:2 [Entrophospora candida]
MYNRITSSKWTKLFVIVSILQLVVIVALETNVLLRNLRFEKTLEDIPSLGGCDLEPSIDRIKFIEEENAIFMMFQLFQLWFYLREACPSDNHLLEPAFTRHDFPLIAMLVAFASIMAFICWKLYLEFGWDIYKKIGADTMLIFVMLIKLSVFFVFISAIEVFLVFSEERDGDSAPEELSIPKRLYYFHMGLIREWKIGMVIYLSLSTIALVDFILILKATLQHLASSWYFFIVFINEQTTKKDNESNQPIRDIRLTIED